MTYNVKCAGFTINTTICNHPQKKKHFTVFPFVAMFHIMFHLDVFITSLIAYICHYQMQTFSLSSVLHYLLYYSISTFINLVQC